MKIRNYILIASFLILNINCNNLDKKNSNQKKIPIILDTDANNELDDQHAIAYMLFSQDIFDIRAITVNETYSGGELKNHVDEATRIVNLCGFENRIKIIPGASGNFNEISKNINEKEFDGNKAVNFIIETAEKMKNEKLILVPIGKLTNISLALHKRPEIAKKIKVIWLGSNWPKPGEYNLKNDPSSVNTILENPEVEFEIVTVRYGEKSGTDAVKISVNEIKRKMRGLGPKIKKSVVGRHGGKFNNFGDYSIELFVKYGHDTRPLFDLCALSILKNPNWAEKKSISKVSFNGLNWTLNGKKDRKITFWENFKRKEIIDDFIKTLKRSETIN